MEEPARRSGRQSSRTKLPPKIHRKKSPMISRRPGRSSRAVVAESTGTNSSSDSPRLLPVHKRTGIYPPSDEVGCDIYSVPTTDKDLYPSPRPNRRDRSRDKERDRERDFHLRDNRLNSRSPVRQKPGPPTETNVAGGALFSDTFDGLERDDSLRRHKLHRATTEPVSVFDDTYHFKSDSATSSPHAQPASPAFLKSHKSKAKRKVRRKSTEKANDMIQDMINKDSIRRKEETGIGHSTSEEESAKVAKVAKDADHAKTKPRLKPSISVDTALASNGHKKKKRKIDNTFEKLRTSLSALRERTVELAPEDAAKEIAAAAAAAMGNLKSPTPKQKKLTVSYSMQRRHSLENLSLNLGGNVMDDDFVSEATLPYIAAAQNATGNKSPRELVDSMLDQYALSPRGRRARHGRSRSNSREKRRSKSPSKKRSRSRSRSPGNVSAVTVMTVLKQMKKQYKMMETRMSQMDEERRVNANERLMLQKLRKELDLCQRENVQLRTELKNEYEALEKKRRDHELDRIAFEKEKEKLLRERMEVIDKQNEMEVIIEHETRLEVLKQIVEKEKEYVRKEWDKLETAKAELFDTREKINEDAHLMYRWKHALDKEKQELLEAHEEHDQQTFRIEVLQSRMDKCKENNATIKKNLGRLVNRVNEETLRVIGAFEDFVDSFSEAFIDCAPRDTDVILSRDQKEWMEQFVPSILNVRDFMDKEHKIQCRWLRNSDDLLNTDEVRIEYPPTGNRKQPASAWRSQLDRAGLKSHTTKDALMSSQARNDRSRRWDNRTGKEENFDAKFRYELEQEEMLLDFEDSDDDDLDDDDDFDFDEFDHKDPDSDDDDDADDEDDGDIDVDALVKSYSDALSDDYNSDDASDGADDEKLDEESTSEHSSFAARKSISATSSDLDLNDLSYGRLEDNDSFRLYDDDDEDDDAFS